MHKICAHRIPGYQELHPTEAQSGRCRDRANSLRSHTSGVLTLPRASGTVKGEQGSDIDACKAMAQRLLILLKSCQRDISRVSLPAEGAGDLH